MSEDQKIQPLIAPEIARALEQTQIGKYHTKGGHGFAAEDANALIDRLSGKHVDQIGTGNSLNGADRLVNGLPIQTKYHHSAALTIKDAFSASDGIFRYHGQVLEVPLDQYDECVRIMQERINGGRVPGVTDIRDAAKIVKRGDITYVQARNIAKAGNIDSIIFDAKSQSITCTYIFAISFAVQFALSKWRGDRTPDAVLRAIESGIAFGAVTMITGVIAAQVLRTRAAAVGAVVSRDGVRLVASTVSGRKAIESLAQASLGKAVYGAAAVNHVAKLLRSNLITASIAVTVTTLPDFYRVAIARSISWQQFTKNLTVNIAGIGVGTAGWVVGASAGVALGTAVPLVGNVIGGVVGGVLGALAGGLLGCTGAKAALDALVQDDENTMLQLLQLALAQLSADYLFSEAEVEELMKDVKTKVDHYWLRSMYQAGGFADLNTARQGFAYNAFDDSCLEIAMKRVKIQPPNTVVVESAINEVVEELCRIEGDEPSPLD